MYIAWHPVSELAGEALVRQWRPFLEEVQMHRATAATLAVIISISGTGPLLAQRAEPNDSPSLERILKLLQEESEGSVLAPLSSAPDLAATHPDLSRLQAGVLYQRTGPSRAGGNATMIAFYALLFGGLAIAIDGMAEDPNNTAKALGGFAMMGGAFIVSCTSGSC